MKIAILGGGPGGLITAYLLESKYPGLCETTLFEASNRTGGKIMTCHFDAAPVIYEAGVAEFYGYGMIGPDPLRQLIDKLGLTTVEMDSQTVIMDGKILRNNHDIQKNFGEKTLKCIREFRDRGAKSYPADEWYDGFAQDDNSHPWAKRSFDEILRTVPDLAARKYLKVASRSDTATEPHLTNALNGLKNCLMDVNGYIDLYSIRGGNESLTTGLAKNLTRTKVELNSPVVSLEKNPDETYRVTYRQDRKFQQEDFDAVMICLPHNWLGSIDYKGEQFNQAMTRHIAYYDNPAHYVRVSVLFKQPFWRDQISGSWFMSDAFGGCCVYDEGTRHDTLGYGVLGWLLAGTDALSLSCKSDSELVDMVLESLPEPLHAQAREMFMEGKVQRWLASVSAQPGGIPIKDTRQAHMPAAETHPGIFVVGDYLFDSTVNGIYDSADFVADQLNATFIRNDMQLELGLKAMGLPVINGHPNGNGSLLSQSNELALSHPPALLKSAMTKGAALLNSYSIGRDYFDDYHSRMAYQNSYRNYFDAKQVVNQIKAVWKRTPPYRILDAGSANGLTLADFNACGMDAWGIESNSFIHRQTPKQWLKKNRLADIRKLPFPDDFFDFTYVTCLPCIPEKDLPAAFAELNRVTKQGVIFAGYASDMNSWLSQSSSQLLSLKTIMTHYEWAQAFRSNGFELALKDDKTIERLWRLEKKYDPVDDRWFPAWAPRNQYEVNQILAGQSNPTMAEGFDLEGEQESMIYSFYDKVRPLKKSLAKVESESWTDTVGILAVRKLNSSPRLQDSKKRKTKLRLTKH